MIITLDLDRLTEADFTTAEDTGRSYDYTAPCIIGTLMDEDQREWAEANTGSVFGQNNGSVRFITKEQAAEARKIQEAFDCRFTNPEAYPQAKAAFLARPKRPIPKGINVNNCAQLARYLESLPEDYEHFNMRTFSTNDKLMRNISEGKLDTAFAECGTAGCAVGHGPDAGIPIPLDDDYWIFFSDSGPHPRWTTYSDLFIDGMSQGTWWTWCFSDAWARCDDTPHGAAKRIWYMLKHAPDGTPEGFAGATVSEYYRFMELYK